MLPVHGRLIEVRGEWDSDREAIKNLPISDKMTRNVETGKLGIDARWEIDIFRKTKAKSRAASNSLASITGGFIFHLG